MKLWKSWVIARKDFATFRMKRYIIYSLVVVPLLISIGLPLLIWLSVRNGIPSAQLPDVISGLNDVLNAFFFLFVLIAGILPISIGAYSIVGEKLEKTLEPLLAPPTTDGEILLGKVIAAFLPSIIATYASAVIFMALMDAATGTTLGYVFFPNWTMAVILLVIVPLISILSTEFNVIISARVSDIRAAQQLGALITLPLAGVYVAAEIDFLLLTPTNLAVISAIILVIDVLLFSLSRATFRREEILTKWK
ncbi:MAG: ABC transporter permease subunit [Halobacteriota archaeon]